MVPPEAAEIFCVAVAIVPATMTGIEALLVESTALVAVIDTIKGVGTALGAS
jgi:hypothetical protein